MEQTSHKLNPTLRDNLARGPLCQHIYPNGLRCCALSGADVHQLVEGRPSPHRHLFEMKCFHTSLRREVFLEPAGAAFGSGIGPSEVIGACEMIDACERASVEYDLKASDAPEPRKSVYERTADRLRAAAAKLRELSEHGSTS